MEMVLAPGSCAQDGQGQGWALPLITGARDSDERSYVHLGGRKKPQNVSRADQVSRGLMLQRARDV